MIFLVMVVVPITLAKQKEHYMKGQLNMLGLTIPCAIYTHLNDSTCVQHLFDNASLHSSLFTSSAPIQNKFDLRTARINLVQDNTEIINRNRNGIILLF